MRAIDLYVAGLCAEKGSLADIAKEAQKLCAEVCLVAGHEWERRAEMTNEGHELCGTSAVVCQRCNAVQGGEP